jgi:hypothetical protein
MRIPPKVFNGTNYRKVRTKEKKTGASMGRRDFLKGAALISTGVMGAGALVACSPNSSSTSGDNTNSGAGQGTGQVSHPLSRTRMDCHACCAGSQ